MNKVYAFNNVDVSDHVESKAGLAYLNWAYVSDVLHVQDPNTQFIVHQFNPFSFKSQQYLNGLVPFNTDPNTGYASVVVTLSFKGHKLTESLPVYNYRGKPVKLPDSLLINKTIKRCEVKAAAELTGLGISLYINGSSKGVNNDEKANSNSNDTNSNANSTSQNGSSNGNSSRKDSDQATGSSASVKQVKYLRYLIYQLSKDYSSSYGQVAKELCDKNGLKSISTNGLSKDQANHLIKSLQQMLPTSTKHHSSDADGHDKAVDKSLDPFANNGQNQVDYPFGVDSQI